MPKNDNPKNVAPPAGLSTEVVTQTKDWEEEQISFPPFWKPEWNPDTKSGNAFFGMPVEFDDRDPDFPRYVMQTESVITCEKGDKANREVVQVQKGEFFTLSAYAALPLDRFIGMRVLVEVVGQRDVGQPQPMYVFKLKVSPADKAQLAEHRKARAAQAMQAFRESRAIRSADATKALPAASA